MARIETYNKVDTPDVEDKLIGTDKDDSNQTKNFRLGDILSMIEGVNLNFTGLEDTPSTYFASKGKIPVVRTTEDGLIFKDPVEVFDIGTLTITGLDDTPSSYSGEAFNVLRVNSAENGMEFYDLNQVITKLNDEITQLTNTDLEFSNDINQLEALLAELENTVNNIPTHANIDVLDKFGEDVNGLPTYNGNLVDTTIAQRDVYDGLDSTDNTISLAASQGKDLKDVQDTQQDEIDLNTAKVSNVQADWDATSGEAEILNKPEIPSNSVGIVTVSGTYNIDWSEHTSWEIVLTGNTVLTQSNPPASGGTKTISLYVIGDFALTTPTEWGQIVNIGKYDGVSGSQIDVQSWNGSSYYPVLNNIAKPNMYLIEPSFGRVSTTFDVKIIGLNFTDTTTVAIQDQVVNSVTFVNPSELLVNITTGSVEGTKNITINNGFETIFQDAFETSLGTIYVPTSADWVLTEPVNVDGNKVLTQTFNSQGFAKWDSQEFDISKDFSVSFNILKSSLGSYVKTGTNQVLQLLKVSDDSELFSVEIRKDASNSLNIRTNSVNDGLSYDYTSNLPTLEENIIALSQLNIEFKLISGTMFLYIDNVLERTFTDTVSENLKLNVRVLQSDVENIKYIEFD